MVKAILALSVVVLAAAAAAQADIPLYTDGVQNGATFNYWDGTVEATDRVHTGSKSLYNVSGGVWVRNDRLVEPDEFLRLQGNNSITFWVNLSGHRMDDLNVFINGTNKEISPAGGSISISTDGVNLATLGNWTEIQLNTWTMVKLTLDGADGWTLGGDSYFEKIGIGLHWAANPATDHIWVDDVWLTGAAAPSFHPGDANKDGVVTDADYTLWADNYNAANATWEQGDFNKDGAVTDADYTIWADHYGHTNQDPVPEPATLSLLSLLGLGLIRRR